MPKDTDDAYQKGSQILARSDGTLSRSVWEAVCEFAKVRSHGRRAPVEFPNGGSLKLADRQARVVRAGLYNFLQLELLKPIELPGIALRASSVAGLPWFRTYFSDASRKEATDARFWSVKQSHEEVLNNFAWFLYPHVQSFCRSEVLPDAGRMHHVWEYFVPVDMRVQNDRTKTNSRRALLTPDLSPENYLLYSILESADDIVAIQTLYSLAQFARTRSRESCLPPAEVAQARGFVEPFTTLTSARLDDLELTSASLRLPKVAVRKRAEQDEGELVTQHAGSGICPTRTVMKDPITQMPQRSLDLMWRLVSRFSSDHLLAAVDGIAPLYAHRLYWTRLAECTPSGLELSHQQ